MPTELEPSVAQTMPHTRPGSDLSIAQRLALSFAFILLPVVLLAGLTLYEHDRINRQQDYVDQVLRPSAAAALDAQTAYLRQGIALRAFVVTGDEARIMEFQRAQESGMVGHQGVDGATYALCCAPSGRGVAAEIEVDIRPLMSNALPATTPLPSMAVADEGNVARVLMVEDDAAKGGFRRPTARTTGASRR